MWDVTSLVSETDYTLFPSNWRPNHEKALLEYTRLEDPKTLEGQKSCIIREQGLVSPQDYTLMLVWNYKRNAIMMDQLSLLKSASSNAGKDEQLLLGSNQEDHDHLTKEMEENNEGIHVAQM